MFRTAKNYPLTQFAQRMLVRNFAHLKSQEEMLKAKINRIKLSEPLDRFSPYDKRTSKLITYVENREYQKALALIDAGLNPDAHTSGENTVLTDCAKRGDVHGARFCLRELKVNPFVSCHCPDHRSAFHYASMNGHINVLKELYDHIGDVNHKDLLTSSKKTPLELAKNQETKQFMLNYKAKTNLELNSMEQLRLTAPDR